MPRCAILNSITDEWSPSHQPPAIPYRSHDVFHFHHLPCPEHKHISYSLTMSTVSEATSRPIDPVAPTTGAPIDPVPLSFPAVLRNPGLNSRFAHLHCGGDSEGRPAPAPVSNPARREDREGKRWVRRKENGALDRILTPSVRIHTRSRLAL